MILRIRNYLLLLLLSITVLSCSDNSQTNDESVEESKSDDKLGQIEFPNSGKKKAQGAFIKGVLALHNFWYPVALESFKEARDLDPKFALAYWGEAMAHNRTFWQRQNKEAALEILNELGETEADRLKGKLSDVEKDFIKSLSILYGEEEEDKLKRDQAYLAFMEKMNKKYPDHHEVSAFYALALLGVLRDNQGNEATRMKCAAVVQRILNENPNHPGALHYKIHAMDDPLHAILALDAAYKYAKVAPESNHALHMPSHIFVQLGMWDEVRRSNTDARKASEKWVAKENLPMFYLDNHSFAWLAYSFTQLGLFDSASAKLAIASMNNADTASKGSKHYELDMLCRNWVENPVDQDDFPNEFDGLEYLGEIDKCKFEFTKGWYHLETDDPFFTMKAINRMKSIIEDIDSTDFFKRTTCIIYLNSLQGLLFTVRDKHELADVYLEKAIEHEESLNPPTGPPDVIKPVHELYAEIMLKRGEYEKAIGLFSTALDRTPNRSMSRLGIARAYRLMNNAAQAKYHYEKLADNYSQVSESEILNEALTFVRNNQNINAIAQLSSTKLNYDEKLKITQCSPLN